MIRGCCKPIRVTLSLPLADEGSRKAGFFAESTLSGGRFFAELALSKDRFFASLRMTRRGGEALATRFRTGRGQ